MQADSPNALFVGLPGKVLADRLSGTVDLVWIDIRGRRNEFFTTVTASDEIQLSLFETAPAPENQRREQSPTGNASDRNRTVLEQLCLDVLRLLRKTGCVFVVCDPTSSYGTRGILDSVCGADRFLREFIVPRHGATVGKSHDTLLVYSKSAETVLQTLLADVPSSRIKAIYRYSETETGRRYALGDCGYARAGHDSLRYDWRGISRTWRWPKDVMANLESTGRLVYTRSGLPRVKRYLDEVSKRPVGSIWNDLDSNHETALAERAILLGSKRGQTILDVSSVSGTLLATATKLQRPWIGVSPAHQDALSVRNDLREALGSAADSLYSFHGPQELRDVRELMRTAPSEFKAWALGIIGAVTPSKPRRSDLGIDGRLWIRSSPTPIPIVIKANLRANELRDVRALIRREKLRSLIVIATSIQRVPPTMNSAKVFVISVDRLVRSDRSRLLFEIEQAFKTRRRPLATTLPSLKQKRA